MRDFKIFAYRLSTKHPEIIQEFAKPHWYEFRRKSALRWLERAGVKFHLVDRKTGLHYGPSQKRV